MNFTNLLIGVCIAVTAPAWARQAKPMTEQGLEELLTRMSVREKIGQLNFCRIGEPGVEKLVRAGEVGGFLNVREHALREKYEKIAVKETRLGIPLLHGADVIHGYRTIFPIPLGQAAAWNPSLCEEAARIAALEATATAGVRWTFSPMVDVARDARWGRIAEGCGEDPYLTGVLGAAMVRGYQGKDLRDPARMAACPKHFAGYGASEGGRDYNTVDISERTLRDFYLPPFKACFDAGAPTTMSAFSELNGVPITGSSFMLRQVLRDEWKFDGFVVSDAKAVSQLVAHGFSENEKDAAQAAIQAGLDVEIISTCYVDHLQTLIAEGKVPMQLLDEAVRRILRVKWKLGLFENPTPAAVKENVLLTPESLATARAFARQSVVLLKNEKELLPLRKEIPSVAVIGPLADDGKGQLGCWMVYGKEKDTRTPLQAIRELAGTKMKVNYAAGLKNATSTDQSGFGDAVRAAKESSVAVLFLGEDASMTGEAHNRAFLNLPGAQRDLLKAVKATGTPIVIVLMAGRPLEIGPALDDSSAFLMAWHPGTMGGPGIADVLFGEYNPAGKLPVSWPRSVGQIPIHYNHGNTGRPNPMQFSPAINDETQLDTSHVTGYVDSASVPQFPFGYGLSYTKFGYSNVRVEPSQIHSGDSVNVTVTLKNTGARAGDEVAQLYIRDLVASVAQPVRELKGFQRVSLAPGESKTVAFVLTSDALAFHNREMKRVTEPGKFQVWASGDSASGQPVEFEIK
ncbi:MAG: beta-glucosidase BglX [Verrucomicrobia bacterium]|nr:beta-glucosidase BglX [Verrucomicrobiota bacterium]